MYPEEIERRFARAGWRISTVVSRSNLVIGYSGDEISLLSHKETWGAADPVFEILDHTRILTHWVRGAPTLLQAGKSFRITARCPRN